MKVYEFAMNTFVTLEVKAENEEKAWDLLCEIMEDGKPMPYAILRDTRDTEISEVKEEVER